MPLNTLAASVRPTDPQTADAVAAALTGLGPRSPHARYAAINAAHRDRHEHRAPLTPDTAAILLDAVRDVMVRDACCVWHDTAAVNLWLDLVAVAPPGQVAPAATLLAVASYQRGDGALVLTALERALDDDPDYALAQLISQLVALATPPRTVTELLARAWDDNPLPRTRPTP